MIETNHYHYKRLCGKRGDAAGSALILVLWVLGLLSMLVASFAFEAHIESRITSFYRNRTKAEYLARSGLDVAELLVSKSAKLGGTVRDEAKAEKDIWYDPSLSLAQGGTVSLVHDMADAGLGEGVIRLTITPEPARRNINTLIDQTPANDETWERIFDVAGIPEEMWPTLIDSFYDWTDEDEASRPDGAETSDYYANLDTPYRAKNGPLDTVGELVLIKGFSREILDGGGLSTGMFEGDKIETTGIADMLTTDGDAAGKVNINAATQRVLMTLPGVDAEMAQYIDQVRGGWVDDAGEERTSFRDENEFIAQMPDFPVLAHAMITTQSSVFRVTSTGELNGVLRTLWCIVQFTDKGFVVLRWREDD